METWYDIPNYEGLCYADMDRKLGRYKGYTSRVLTSGLSQLAGSDGIIYKVV